MSKQTRHIEPSAHEQRRTTTATALARSAEKKTVCVWGGGGRGEGVQVRRVGRAILVLLSYNLALSSDAAPKLGALRLRYLIRVPS